MTMAPEHRPETRSEWWARRTPSANTATRGSDTPPRNLDELIEQMDRTPESGIAMCHAQGKTAVYVSQDGRFIVEHPPHGPIIRRPRDPDTSRQP